MADSKKYTGHVSGITAEDISDHENKPTVGYTYSLMDDEEASFNTRMKHLGRHLVLLARWIVLGVIIGLFVGAFRETLKTIQRVSFQTTASCFSHFLQSPLGDRSTLGPSSGFRLLTAP